MSSAHVTQTGGLNLSVIKPAQVVLALLVVAVVVLLRAYGSHIALSLLAQATIISLMALGVGFLIRTSGLVSFGHAAPFGLGAYGVAYVFGSHAPVAPEIGILLIAPVVTVIFFLVGLVVSRLEGIAFGMLTLALGQSVNVAATKFRDITGGADGLIIALPNRLFGFQVSSLQTPGGMFVFGFVVMACVIIALIIFEASRMGRVAVAIRENEERVRFLGYRTRALRAAVYALSCGIACISGMLYGLYQGFVSPEILHWSFSGSALIMAILGGSVALWGPIAGAFGFFFIREWLTEITSHWLAILGVLLIIVTVKWPTGLSGALIAIGKFVRTRALGRA